MSALSQQQVDQFREQGFLKVDGVLDPAAYLDPVIDEYAGVLDSLAQELFASGEISSTYDELPFGERVTRIYAESGRAHGQYFDFSLPFSDVREDTPFWCGPAVLNAFTAEPLLDVVESLIGPEIYSNPVQHVRIKPPESELPRNQQGKPVIGATQWHQDHGVVTPDADETNMLTVWFSLYDTPIEAGPLKVVPGSHKGGLRAHCANYRGHGGREIPEKLFEVERTRPLPTARGDMICLHRQTVHGSLANVGDKIRWSFDLRYNPIGQHTGREAFPGFVARSRKAPHLELRDADRWRRDWQDTRHKMARINRGGQTDVPFGRWADGHPDCA
jgi:hypothetical protein